MGKHLLCKKHQSFHFISSLVKNLTVQHFTFKSSYPTNENLDQPNTQHEGVLYCEFFFFFPSTFSRIFMAVTLGEIITEPQFLMC